MRAAIRHLGAAMIASLVLVPSVAFALDSDADGVPDNADAFPFNASLAAEAYAPARGEFGNVFFEDMWPFQGDFDFNDATVAYNYLVQLDAQGRLVNLKGSINLMSAGASYHNRLLVHFPIPVSAVGSVTLNGLNGILVALTPKPGENDLVVEVSPDMLDALGGGTLVNTQPNVPSVPAVPLNLLLRLSTPTAFDLGEAPFDIMLVRVGDPGLEIHRPEYAGTSTMNGALFNTGNDGSTMNRHFVTTAGIPFALVVPYATAWPQEYLPIDQTYPDILPFGSSAGATNTDWYQTSVTAGNLWTQGAGGSPAPVAQIIPPDFDAPGNPCTGAPDGTACMLANATAACQASVCGLVSCNANFGNCDMDVSNGCEANFLNSNSNCGACGNACANGQTCTNGTCQGGFFDWQGVILNTPKATFVGWSEVFAQAYGTFGPSLSQIQSLVPNGYKVAYACAANGSPNYQVAAWAPRADVFQVTPDCSNQSHLANGAYWYFNNSCSMGFSPISTISQNSADTQDAPGFANSFNSGDKRISWHTGGGQINGGWRCGNTTFLNGEPSGFTRYILIAP